MTPVWPNCHSRVSETSGFVYKPDFHRAAQMAIRLFREGRLGKVNLDCTLIAKMQQSPMSDDDQAIRKAMQQRDTERVKTVLQARMRETSYAEES